MTPQGRPDPTKVPRVGDRLRAVYGPHGPRHGTISSVSTAGTRLTFVWDTVDANGIERPAVGPGPRGVANWSPRRGGYTHRGQGIDLLVDPATRPRLTVRASCPPGDYLVEDPAQAEALFRSDIQHGKIAVLVVRIEPPAERG